MTYAYQNKFEHGPDKMLNECWQIFTSLNIPESENAELDDLSETMFAADRESNASSGKEIDWLTRLSEFLTSWFLLRLK